jgi:hypothetical protein
MMQRGSSPTQESPHPTSGTGVGSCAGVLAETSDTLIATTMTKSHDDFIMTFGKSVSKNVSTRIGSLGQSFGMRNMVLETCQCEDQMQG